MKVHNRKLYKSKDNKIISGVMGGLGEYFEVDPTIFRIIYLVITVLSHVFPAIIAYILMAIVIPSKPETVHTEAKTDQPSN